MTDDGFQAKELRHFIYVAQPPNQDRYFAIMTIYFETDALSAVGQVWQFVPTPDRSDPRRTALNTNDDLCSMWASPEGNLWVGSSRGRMWTTADVSWDASKIPQIDWNESDPVFHWKGTEAPPDPKGGGFNLAAVSGSSDRDVHVGTFEGVILHWNGSQWQLGATDNRRSIQRMHGTAQNNMWAVGRDGVVLHFDGQRWRPVPLPGDASRGENLTGVWAVSDDEVYICSSSGAIFHGGPQALERLGEYPYAFYGIVELNGDLFLAAADAGVAVLRGNQVSIIKDTFAATGVYRLTKMLAFVEPTQEKPRVIIHDPAAPRPWVAFLG